MAPPIHREREGGGLRREVCPDCVVWTPTAPGKQKNQRQQTQTLSIQLCLKFVTWAPIFTCAVVKKIERPLFDRRVQWGQNFQIHKVCPSSGFLIHIFVKNASTQSPTYSAGPLYSGRCHEGLLPRLFLFHPPFLLVLLVLLPLLRTAAQLGGEGLEGGSGAPGFVEDGSHALRAARLPTCSVHLRYWTKCLQGRKWEMFVSLGANTWSGE